MKKMQTYKMPAKRILKYRLPINGDRKAITCGLGRWLAVQPQNGWPHVWVMVDDNAPQIEYEIISVGTGWDLPIDFKESNYLGTAQDSGGFVWHYFVQLADKEKELEQLMMEAWLDEIFNT